MTVKFLSIKVLALALMTFGCTKTSKKTAKFETPAFSKEINLEGTPIGPKNAFMRTRKAILINNFIIVLDTKSTPYSISIVDLHNDNTMYHIAHNGQGPSEFISAWDIRPDVIQKNSFWTLDATSQSYSKYVLDSIFAGNLKPCKRIKARNPMLRMDDFVVTDKHIICNGPISCAQLAFLSLDNGLLIRESERIPIEVKYEKKVSNEILALAYVSRMGIKPDLSRIAIGTSMGDYLSIYDSSGVRLKTIRTPERLEPIFEVSSNGHWGYTDESRYGYHDIACSDRYIYAQYGGKTHDGDIKYTSKYINVYTWDGEPVVRLVLDRYVLGICVDEERNTLYALEIFANQPIIKYTLPNLLKL